MLSVALADIMSYYSYNFVLVYCLGLIAALSTIAGFIDRLYLKYAILFTILSGVSMASNILFLGVLADNRAPNHEKWFLQAMIIGLVVLALLIAQIIRYLYTKPTK